MKEIDIKANSSQPPALARCAFTLVELLIVISVIGVLAAFTVTTLSGVFRNKYISTARSEMAFIQAGIDRYKATYGVYPPSGDINQPNRFTVNPLYFELQGVTNDNGTYYTLDRMNNVKSTFVNSSFGVDGFLNSSKGSGEDAVPAKVFLSSLKANQVGSVTNPAGSGNPAVAILISSVGGPDQNYQPLGAQGLNPWRYNSANPTNNPGSYDLWIQLKIGGKTNLISNWSKQAQINSPLP